jgi:hypothetical protein
MKETQINTLIKSFQREMEKTASPKTKAWWKGHMKHVIPFRGVGIPKIRELLADWQVENGLNQIGLIRNWPLSWISSQGFYRP